MQSPSHELTSSWNVKEMVKQKRTYNKKWKVQKTEMNRGI